MYSKDRLEAIFSEQGEVMIVMESDREYELHSGNTNFGDNALSAEGLITRDGDTEFISVVLPYKNIEHHYTHAAL